MLVALLAVPGPQAAWKLALLQGAPASSGRRGWLPQQALVSADRMIREWKPVVFLGGIDEEMTGMIDFL